MNTKEVQASPQDGNIVLVQQLANGRIIQLGITPMQAMMLNAFVKQISKETPIMRMSEEHDLVLKSDVRVMKKRK